MVTTITALELFDILVGMNGAFILQNPHGSMELRGTDFYLRHTNDWITLYHRAATSPESRSHFHLKWRTLRWATVDEAEGQTPQVSFFMAPESVDEPALIWYFPSFYDWAHNKSEIPAHIALFEAFVEKYGKTLQQVEPAP
jgi:hypothetical protein